MIQFSSCFFFSALVQLFLACSWFYNSTSTAAWGVFGGQEQPVKAEVSRLGVYHHASLVSWLIDVYYLWHWFLVRGENLEKKKLIKKDWLQVVVVCCNSKNGSMQAQLETHITVFAREHYSVRIASWSTVLFCQSHHLWYLTQSSVLSVKTEGNNIFWDYGHGV